MAATVSPYLVQIASPDVTCVYLRTFGEAPLDLSAHRTGCSCWRCEAVSKANPDRVWSCLRDWRRTAVTRNYAPVAPLAVGVDRRLLPERARVLRGAGLTMQAIADELHCAASTVCRHLHSA